MVPGVKRLKLDVITLAHFAKDPARQRVGILRPNGLLEFGQRGFNASTPFRSRRRSALRIERFEGLRLRKLLSVFRIRLKNSPRITGRRNVGKFGNFEGDPATNSADSSYTRAMCSTTWDGDHFPGARGVVHVDATPSDAEMNSLTALRLTSSAFVTSLMTTPSSAQSLKTRQNGSSSDGLCGVKDYNPLCISSRKYTL